MMRRIITGSGLLCLITLLFYWLRPPLNAQDQPRQIFLPTIVRNQSAAPPLITTPRATPPSVNTGPVYYLSPTGSDTNDGLTGVTAWATFTRTWETLSPGDTLMLLDGVYYQSLNPPQSSGLPDAPMTIRAQNDGKAIIDGEFQRVPVQLGRFADPVMGNYFVIEGIVARNSAGTVYEIWGNHNTLRRVSGYNGNRDTNDHVFTIAATHDTLLEDCIASGTGRKMIFSWGGHDNVIRRCLAKWEQYDSRLSCGEWPWGEDLELYNSSNNIIENSISFGVPPKSAVSVLGNINSTNGNTPVANDNRILGVMTVRNGVYPDGSFWAWPLTRPEPTECDVVSKLHEWAGWRVGFAVTLWGDTAQVQNTFFQDIFAWGGAGLGFTEIHPYNRSANMTINRATIFNNGLDVPPGDGEVGTNAVAEQLDHYQITNSNIEDLAAQGGGARLAHRYVAGVLLDGTNGEPAQPLWPWPMQDRVLTELGIDITGEMAEVLHKVGVTSGADLPPPDIAPLPLPANLARNIGTTTYLAPVEVTLTSLVSGADLHYTTDGSEPEPDSPRYTGPFTLNGNTIVKAKIFFNGKRSHSRAAYYQIDPSHANQPPIVEAAALPFVHPKVEIMFPRRQLGLYGLVFDATLPNPSHGLQTIWHVAQGPPGVSFANQNLPRTTATFSQPGDYVLRLTASDGTLTTSADVQVTVLPDGGVPVTLPGRVEAENYLAGGEGVAYHDTSLGNFGQTFELGKQGTIYRDDDVDLAMAWNESYGYSVIHMDPGEWLAYAVDVTQAGVYSLTARVASPIGGGVFHVELDGVDISGPLVTPYTDGGIRIYTSTLQVRTPPLPQGRHTLRIVANYAPPNEKELWTAINYLDFMLVEARGGEPPAEQPPVTRRINAPYWATGAPYPSRSIAWTGKVTPSANYADIRTIYDDSQLKVTVHVIDRLLHYDTTPTLADLAKWDAVSLYLQPINGPSYRLIAQLSNDAPQSNWQAGYRLESGAWVADSIPFTTTTEWRGEVLNDASDDKGWVAYFFIPYSSLGLTAPPPVGTTWPLALRVHDRDDAAGAALPDVRWPETLADPNPERWGKLRFGLPIYTPPAAQASTVITTQQIIDAHVGGHGTCGETTDHWRTWGETNYAHQQQITIQNQWDISDYPCFSKYYITVPLNHLPADKAIISATLTLHLFGNAGYEAGQAKPSWIQALTVQGDWDEATINWNTAPLAVENIGGTWVQPVDFFAPNGVPYQWDVSQAVADAYARGQPLRLAFYSADGEYHSGKYFWSADMGDVTVKPTLRVQIGE